MTKPIRGDKGRFRGSIGDGKKSPSTPTHSTEPRPAGLAKPRAAQEPDHSLSARSLDASPEISAFYNNSMVIQSESGQGTIRIPLPQDNPSSVGAVETPRATYGDHGSIAKAYVAFQKMKAHPRAADELRDLSEKMDFALEDIFVLTDAPDGETAVALYDYAFLGTLRIMDKLQLAYDIRDTIEIARKRDPGLLAPDWRIGVISHTFGAFESAKYKPVYAAPTFVSPVDQSEWVIDYCAKELDRRAPYPILQPKDLWSAWIIKHQTQRGLSLLKTRLE